MKRIVDRLNDTCASRVGVYFLAVLLAMVFVSFTMAAAAWAGDAFPGEPLLIIHAEGYDGLGSISGRVTDEYANGIAGADVWADFFDGGWAGGTKTDDQGYYSIGGLPTGDYRVAAKALGRVMRFYNDTLWHDEATAVTVTAPDTTPSINFSLEPGGSISGVITDASGSPLSGVSVDAGRTDGPGGSGAETREDGSYTIDGLPYGTYKVFSPSGGRWGTNDGNWAREQHPQEVTINDGAPNATGIDFGLELGGSISGVITDASGSPLSGVSVDASRIDGSGGSGAETREDGSYTIEGLPYGSYKVFSPSGGRWGTNDGNWAREQHPQEVTINDGAPNATGIDFSLEPGGSISGVITDASGSPLSGVSVDASRIDGSGGSGSETREDGSYTIDGLPYGTYKVFSPSGGRWGINDGNWAREQHPQEVTINDGAPNATGIDFSLEPGGSISGVITDASGSPLSGVSVDASRIDGSGGSGSETREDGSYTIDGLPYGTYKVFSPSGGRWGTGDGDWAREKYPSEITIDTTNPNLGDVDFTLEPGGSISGRITNQSGTAGVPNAHVWAERNAGSGKWVNVSNTQTDENGYYVLKGIPSGEYKVGAEAEGMVRTFYPGTGNWGEAEVLSVTAPYDLANIVFSLEPGGTISGRVTDKTGNGIAGADVWADFFDGGWAGGTKTDDQGYYSIGGLPTGDYRVAAKALGRVMRFYNDTLWHDEATAVTVTAPDTTPSINFSLEPGGSISGVITDAFDSPLSGVSVDAGRTDGPGGSGSETREDGSYTIEGLPFGTYNVFSPSGGRWGTGDGDWAREQYPSEVTIDTTNPNLGDVDFTLEHGGSISGHITNQSGTAGVPNAHVWAERNAGSGKWANVSNTQTDESGYYVLKGIPSGEYKVGAEAEGMVRTFYPGTGNWDEAEVLAVTAPDTTPNINFSLEPGGSISGVITDASGSPLSGVSVDAGRTDGPGGSGSETREDGSYTIEGLPFGTYNVFSPSGGRWGTGDGDWAREQYPSEVTIDTTNPNLGDVDFTLEPGGSISGHITNQSGTAGVPNAHVWAERNAGSGKWANVSNTQTDESGYYVLKGIPSGEYKVGAEAEGMLRTFYPGTGNWDEAEVLSVTAPDALLNINFSTRKFLADLNDDGTVDLYDIVTWAKNWEKGLLEYDVDSNGQVNMDDLRVIGDFYGR